MHRGKEKETLIIVRFINFYLNTFKHYCKLLHYSNILIGMRNFLKITVYHCLIQKSENKLDQKLWAVLDI